MLNAKGQISFLGGKVLQQSLPVVEAPSGPEAPARKRLLLPQGELAQFYDSDEPIHYLAFIELRPGAVRGNHYHRAKEEMLYVIQGEVLLMVADIESRARDSLALKAGDLAVIRTGVAHALRTVQPGQAVEFSRARFDPGDIHRFSVA